MTILKGENIEMHYEHFGPLARLLAINSTDSDDIVNLCKFYEKIFYQATGAHLRSLVK